MSASSPVSPAQSGGGLPANTHETDDQLRKIIGERDATIGKLRRQLNGAISELKKVQDHSKHQSQEFLKLKKDKETSAASNETALNEEIEDLKLSLSRTGQQLSRLEQENVDLQNQVAMSLAQAAIYKEDFEREREDRTKAAGKMESLERQKESQLPQNQQKEEVKRLQKEVSQLHRQLSSTQRDLASSREEVQAKVSQVKQYKKQLDTQEAKISSLEKDLHESGLLFVTIKKENVKLQQQLEKVQKKADKAMKQDLRAEKKEQEKKMKEEQEKRKNTMSSMDMKGRTAFLEKEIAKMEEENNMLKQNLAISEQLSVFLHNKLDEADLSLETLKKLNEELGFKRQKKIMTSVEETQPALLVRAKDPRPSLDNVKSSTGYINVASRIRDDEAHSDYVHIFDESDLQQPRSAQSDPTDKPNALLNPNRQRHSKTAPHSKLPTETEDSTRYCRMQGNLPPQTKDPALHSKKRDYVNYPPITDDPALFSKTKEYVNLPPATAPVRNSDTPPTPPPRKPQATPRQTPDTPQSRSATMDRVRSSSTKITQDTVSLPDGLLNSEDEDISNDIDTVIQHEATEVATATAPDRRGSVLDTAPYDPYLRCAYCDKMFRHGEIQKYKKHVHACTNFPTHK